MTLHLPHSKKFGVSPAGDLTAEALRDCHSFKGLVARRAGEHPELPGTSGGSASSGRRDNQDDLFRRLAETARGGREEDRREPKRVCPTEGTEPLRIPKLPNLHQTMFMHGLLMVLLTSIACSVVVISVLSASSSSSNVVSNAATFCCNACVRRVVRSHTLIPRPR